MAIVFSGALFAMRDTDVKFICNCGDIQIAKRRIEFLEQYDAWPEGYDAVFHPDNGDAPLVYDGSSVPEWFSL